MNQDMKANLKLDEIDEAGDLPPGKRPRRSTTTRATPKSTPAKGRGKQAPAYDSAEEESESENEMQEDSDYDPSRDKDDPPSPKASLRGTGGKKRGRGGKAAGSSTPRKRGGGGGGRKKKADVEFDSSDAGSTDVDEEEEDFEIQEGIDDAVDDAVDIFADEPSAPRENVYEFDAESTTAEKTTKKKSTNFRQSTGRASKPAQSSAIWGTNIYSALATILKTRTDLENYTKFLRSPYLNIELDQFLMEFCKPSPQHSSLFFGPSASLQALMSRVGDSDTIVDALNHFMTLNADSTVYKSKYIIPLIHQSIVPVAKLETAHSEFASLTKNLGYDVLITPGYQIDTNNIYSKPKQFSSYSSHQLVSLLSILPLGGFSDLSTNIILSAPIYKEFSRYVTSTREEVLDFAENPEKFVSSTERLGRVVLITDPNAKVLALAVLETADKFKTIRFDRKVIGSASSPSRPPSPSKVRSPRAHSGSMNDVKDMLDEIIDFVGSSTEDLNRPRFEPIKPSMEGIHIMDAVLLSSNAKPQLLLAVGIRNTAIPAFKGDEVGSIILCSMMSDEDTFLKNQGIAVNVPVPTKGRFLLDCEAFAQDKCSLLIPDPLYANIRKMAITEVISTSGTVAGLGVAALPISKESDIKWLILDSKTHMPVCLAVKLPCTFSIQVGSDREKKREPGKSTAVEVSSYTEEQLGVLESAYSLDGGEFKVVVINGMLCAIQFDQDNLQIHKVYELLPASVEDMYPSDQGSTYSCQAISSNAMSKLACIHVHNKDTEQSTFLPSIIYSGSDFSVLARVINRFCDSLHHDMLKIPLKFSLYDLALRLALRDTPRILARQQILSSQTAAEQHEAEHPDEPPLEIPAIPEKWTVCSLCLREFHSSVGLYHHELRHMNVGRYSCSAHDAIFISEEAYKRHMTGKDHRKGTSNIQTKLESIPAEQEEDDYIADSVLKLFHMEHALGEIPLQSPQCHSCGDYFPTNDLIALHMEICTGETCSSASNKNGASLYTCGICAAQVDTKSMLKTHFTEAHLKCVVCGLTQRSLEELSYHYSSHLQKADPVFLQPLLPGQLEENDIGARLRSIQTCQLCQNYHGTASNFAYHQWCEHGVTRGELTAEDMPMTATGYLDDAGNQLAGQQDKNEITSSRRLKTMQCKFCEMEVPVAGSAYVNHLSQVHNVEVDMFQICRICADVFQSDQALSLHIAAEHPLNVYAMAGIQSVYSCPKCVFYSFYRGMMNHCREMHNDHHPDIYECTHCAMRFGDRFEYRRHSESHTDGYNFQCPDCNRSFRLRMSLMVHMKNHHSANEEIGPKACEFCGLVYPSGRLLKQHIDRSHNKELKLECHDCGRRFKMETDLRRHIKEMHSGAVKCEVCNKICANLRSYSMHRNKHFRMRVFQCTDCNATFKSKASMKRHIRVDHLNLGPERFECQICGKIVCQIGMHMLTHKGTRFICEYCGKGFTKSAYYNEHIRIHKGELPYECYICHKRFNKKSNLNVHLKFHEKNKDSEGNYIELRTRGRYSIMFGDASLTPEQRMARQSALNFAIMPTEHMCVGPDEPGAFNVGGRALAAEEACLKALEEEASHKSQPIDNASLKFDQMLAQEGMLSNGKSKVANGGILKATSPRRVNFIAPSTAQDDDEED